MGAALVVFPALTVAVATGIAGQWAKALPFDHHVKGGARSASKPEVQEQAGSSPVAETPWSSL